MRISDWSSDVCSSDLQQRIRIGLGDAHALLLHLLRQARDRRLDLVLDLHLRDVGVGAFHEDRGDIRAPARARSEEHTSELQSLMRISYAVFCLKKESDTALIDAPDTTHQIISVL